jgi:hypothetical protein
LPPVGALDQLRGANGEGGILERARSSPRLVVAFAAGLVLILAWVGWAIYVTSSNGASAGLGVVIAWPAMLAALALILLPFIGVYLLVRRLSPSEDEGSTATTDEQAPADDEVDEDEQETSDEEAEDSDDGEDEDDESESDSEAEASKAG